jgi:hypothetical protein
MPTSRLQPEQLSWILDVQTDLLVSDMRRARSAFQKPLYRRQGNAPSANRTRGVRDPKWVCGKRKIKIWPNRRKLLSARTRSWSAASRSALNCQIPQKRRFWEVMRRCPGLTSTSWASNSPGGVLSIHRKEPTNDRPHILVLFGRLSPRPLVPRAGPALEYETAAEGSFVSPHSFRCHIHSLQVSFDFIRKDS